MTPMRATVTGLAAGIEHVGNKLYMGSFFSSPASYDDLNTKTINCCGVVDQIENKCQNIFDKMNLKMDDLKTKVVVNVTAIVWRDK
jgi:hypothetical protein